MSIQTTNPATNKVLKSFDEMTDEQVEAAIEKLLLKGFWTIEIAVAELMRQRKDNLR
jgi:succinate-semialdehyde dehydrogenase/glutarate-semialdehyde dehydrogenase